MLNGLWTTCEPCFTPHDDVLVTFFHVLIAPQPNIYLDQGQSKLELEKRHGHAFRQLEAMQARLVRLSVPDDHIRMKIQVCAPGDHVASAFLEEQRRGGYQTVEVGQRGISKREEFLFDSVSSKSIREARECTVWVLRRTAASQGTLFAFLLLG